MRQFRFFTISLTHLFMLASCSHQGGKDWRAADEYQKNRYSQKKDSTPSHRLSGHIADAVPRHEEPTKAGNISPYKVFGKTYHILPTAKGYKATGEASWYGMKFHGHKTANGEVYDVNKMSAAHKTLPIPSYVRVTNLENNRSCIVRVNDRGPFKSGRLIDLSYAAATKLGYTHKGTTRVRVEAVMPGDVNASQKRAETIAKTGESYLQLGAFKSLSNAQSQYSKMTALLGHSVILKKTDNGLYKLYVGPLSSRENEKIRAKLRTEGYSQPVNVQNIMGL